jgi:hypothetical protein
LLSNQKKKKKKKKKFLPQFRTWNSPQVQILFAP